MLAGPHLPQGAPTSPALANLAALQLDRRLAGLAWANGLVYSRYADDLTFSGDRMTPGRRRHLIAWVEAIVQSAGFAANADKTRCQLSGGRQSVCGVVVNAHPNLVRGESDRLTATIHNILMHGPAGQNRAGVDDLEAQLGGRIAWLSSLHRARGARLRERFEQIDWSAGA